MTADAVQHEPRQQRLFREMDGHVAELLYRSEGGLMTIVHTGVPAAIGGRGVAATLVRAALELAREHGWKVVPACSYAEAYMDKYPEYQDLRA